LYGAFQFLVVLKDSRRDDIFFEYHDLAIKNPERDHATRSEFDACQAIPALRAWFNQKHF